MAATTAGQPEGSTKAVLETRRQQLSFGPAWYGGWHVGEGYSGVASVWVEEGTGGTITDVSVHEWAAGIVHKASC